MTLLISTPAIAKSKFWASFGSEKKNLKVIQSGFINENCEKCQAKGLLSKSASLKKENIKLKNPYAVACSKLNGKVRIAKLYSGHSQSFCFMPDNSFVSTNLLSFKVED
tara:strand:- start:187 stop:513 length:327 start_codon:yes stop_codon:yes gene_type:complete